MYCDFKFEKADKASGGGAPAVHRPRFILG